MSDPQITVLTNGSLGGKIIATIRGDISLRGLYNFIPVYILLLVHEIINRGQLRLKGLGFGLLERSTGLWFIARAFVNIAFE